MISTTIQQQTHIQQHGTEIPPVMMYASTISHLYFSYMIPKFSYRIPNYSRCAAHAPFEGYLATPSVRPS